MVILRAFDIKMSRVAFRHFCPLLTRLGGGFAFCRLFFYSRASLRLENKMSCFGRNPYLLNGSVERYEKSFISCLISDISLTANAAGEKISVSELRRKGICLELIIGFVL